MSDNQNSQAPMPTPPTPPSPTPPPSPSGRTHKHWPTWFSVLFTVVSGFLTTFIACIVAYLLVGAVFSAAENIDFDSLNSTSQGNKVLTAPPDTMDVGISKLTVDLDSMLENALEAAGCTETTVEVTNLTKDSTTKPLEEDEYFITRKATGQATITYEGRTETVTYTSYYLLKDPSDSSLTWYSLDFELSSYALFPPALQEYKAVGGTSGSAAADTVPPSAA